MTANEYLTDQRWNDLHTSIASNLLPACDAADEHALDRARDRAAGLLADLGVMPESTREKGGDVTDQPIGPDWAVADEFWKLVHEIYPAKARTLITTIVASTPQTLQQARNALRDASMLRG